MSQFSLSPRPQRLLLFSAIVIIGAALLMAPVLRTGDAAQKTSKRTNTPVSTPMGASSVPRGCSSPAQRRRPPLSTPASSSPRRRLWPVRWARWEFSSTPHRRD